MYSHLCFLWSSVPQCPACGNTLSTQCGSGSSCPVDMYPGVPALLWCLHTAVWEGGQKHRPFFKKYRCTYCEGRQMYKHLGEQTDRETDRQMAWEGNYVDCLVRDKQRQVGKHTE